MPRFDGKGPHGVGPMTGGCRGYCVVPLNTPEQDIVSLKDQAQSLREQLKQIEASINRIENTRSTK